MKIAILGVGAYGIALGKAFFENDNQISMWTKFQEEADIIQLKRENMNYFPGVKIPKAIEITTDMEACMRDAKIIVIALPMGAMQDTAKTLAQYVKNEQVICIATKGIETKSNRLMSEIVFEETKSKNIAMLAGPSFAMEFANGCEVGLTVASESSMARTSIKVCLENARIKVNLSRDMVGVEVASAIKNVFAILMGILDGMKKQDSMKAAVFALLTEDFRVILEVMGGKVQTIFTYAGLGDFFLTCMSPKSRNYTFGRYIGQGMTKEEAMKKMETKTIEGLYTLESIQSILEEKEIKVRSIDLIYDMVYQNKKVDHILTSLNK